MSKSKYKILPCPHCGGPAKFACNKSGKGVCYIYVRCIVCGASGKTARVGSGLNKTEQDAERDAVLSWNLRTPLKTTDEADQDPETVDQAETTPTETDQTPTTPPAKAEGSDRHEAFVLNGPDVETVETVDTINTL